MKKMTIFLLVAVMLITAGCGANTPEATEAPVPETTLPATEAPTVLPTEAPTEVPTEAPTEAPTEPVPTCSNAVIQADDAPAILTLLNRGDTVDVVGEYDEDHYVVVTDSGYGLVEKQLLRMTGEPDYEVWTGYAYSNAEVYANYQLTGEIVTKLKKNTKVEVLDELKYCYVVTIDEKTAFVDKSQLSKTRLKTSSGKSGNADGGDIVLRDGGIVRLSSIQQSGEVTGTATVLADKTQVILGYFQKDELVPVVAEEGFAPPWDGCYTLYLDGMYAYLPKNLALAEGGESYAQWDGFSRSKAEVYDNYLLQGECTTLKINTSITVLWDGGEFYVVSIDGDIGYMAPDQVGTKRFATGGGGGGNSGGDWTPPVM